MAELDPFFDLHYLNAPGFGDSDVTTGDGTAPSATVSSGEPTIAFPGADPPSAAPAAPLPAYQAPPAVITPPPAAGARSRAGAAIVFAGVGAGTGALLGGAWGAGSGLLFAGALMNAYRAKSLYGTGSDADKSEAVKSTVMAVIGLGVGSYLGYRAHQSKSGARDDDD